MNRFRNYVLGLAALAVLAGMFAAPHAIAQIRAALIRDSDNPALQPVVVSLTSTFQIPAGKRLIIEYVSWSGTKNFGSVAAAGITAVTSGQEVTHWVPGSTTSFDNIGGKTVWIAADPGTELTLQMGQIGIFAPVILSGHYVNIP